MSRTQSVLGTEPSVPLAGPTSAEPDVPSIAKQPSVRADSSYLSSEVDEEQALENMLSSTLAKYHSLRSLDVVSPSHSTDSEPPAAAKDATLSVRAVLSFLDRLKETRLLTFAEWDYLQGLVYVDDARL